LFMFLNKKSRADRKVPQKRKSNDDAKYTKRAAEVKIACISS